MARKYRAALVGLGDIACRYNQRINAEYCLTHAATYIHNYCTTIVAGCSPDENDRLSFQNNFDVPVYKTMDELIDGSNPDIVSICSPEKFHYEQVLCCFERNILMIWLEKPPKPRIKENEHDDYAKSVEKVVRARTEYKCISAPRNGFGA